MSFFRKFLKDKSYNSPNKKFNEDEWYEAALRKSISEIKEHAKCTTKDSRKYYCFVKRWSREKTTSWSMMIIPKEPNIGGRYVGFIQSGEFFEAKHSLDLCAEWEKWNKEIHAERERILEKYPEIKELYQKGLIKFNF